VASAACCAEVSRPRPEAGDVLGGPIGAGQQTLHEAHVGDDTHAVLLAGRDHLELDGPREQVVAQLVRCECGAGPHERVHLLHAVVRHPERPDLASGLEFFQRRDGALDVLGRHRPVNLVQIDIIRAQPLQAGLQMRADGVRRGVSRGDLGRDQGAVTSALEGLPDDLLAVPGVVRLGGVEQRDPVVQRGVDSGDRLPFVHVTPAFSATQWPATQPDDAHP